MWLDKMNYMELPTQKKYVVAFIDLLGVSSAIEAESQWTLDYIWLFYKIIVEKINSRENIKFKIFSDNILVCKEIEKKCPECAILDVIYIVEQIELQMFNIGASFTRGAMVVDYLYIDNNFVYGKALINAYNLENKKAIYPRVLIDESVINLVKGKCKYIILDNDNQYFYDFLQLRIDQGKKMLELEFSIFQGNIITNLKRKSICDKVLKKMIWLINYFNKTCIQNGMRHRINVDLLNKYGISITEQDKINVD